MKSIFTLMLISLSFTVIGKGICMSFIVKNERSSSYTLHLKKNNSYKYVYSSISLDSKMVLDSGTYSLNEKTVIFKSNYTKESNMITNSTFMLKEINVKKHQTINTNGVIYSKKKSLFGTKMFLLVKSNDEDTHIISSKPTDNIIAKSFEPANSIKQWIEGNVLPTYQYKATDLNDTNWINIFESKDVNILAVSNQSDLFGIYFLFNYKVYYTTNQKSLEYHQAIIDKVYNEKLINLTQKNEIEKKIKSLITQGR